MRVVCKRCWATCRKTDIALIAKNAEDCDCCRTHGERFEAKLEMREVRPHLVER